MGKYKTYADRVDTLAKEAFAKVKDAAAALEKAETQAKLYPQRTGGVDPDYYAKSARAAADLAEAKQNYTAAMRGISTLNENIRGIRKELAAQIDKDGRANPEAVDTATLELLKSGILTESDYVGLLEKNRDNLTMTRLIKKNIEENAKIMGDTPARQHLLGLAMSVNTDSTTLRNFDVLADVCNRVEHNTRMIDSYETLTAQARANM
jgi:hypothetical protein